jgi:hypothetical protein
VGTETLSFPDALAAEPLRLSLDKSGHKANCYRFHSSYGSILREWQKTFDPSSFHFVRKEDFQDHWDSVMAGIFQFLGVDDSIIIPVIHKNEGRSSGLGLMRLYHRIPEGIRGRVGSIFNQKQRSELIDLLYRFERKKSADNPIFLEPEIDRKLRLEFVKEIELAQEITGLDLRAYLPSS